MSTRSPLDGQGMAIMVLLCAIWGLQQIELKAVASDFSPTLQIALRSGLAAVLVLGLMFWQHKPLNLRQNWKPGLLAGSLFGLEFLLVGEGLRYTSASHMVVLLYTAPIFVALGMHWKFPAERLSRLQWLGVLLAFAGIAVSFLGSDSQPSASGSNVLWGDFLALLAGASWGATTVTVRSTSLASAPALETLFYQLLMGFVLILAGAIWTGQLTFQPGPVTYASLLFQTLVVSFGSFLTWFALLKRYMAPQLGVFSFLTPLFGVLFGVWLLDEPLEPGFALGTTMVVGGLLTVSGYGWYMARRRRRQLDML
ncbi:MAG TPA: DMT family transporter [Thiolinea sp.]|nr:DMT family transporter [Thiolinea sp.]